MSDDRRHEPTARRRERAREQGHVARSSDLVAAFALLAILGAFWVFGKSLVGFLAGFLREQLGGAPNLHASADDFQFVWRQMTVQAATASLPVLGILIATVLVIHFAQTGFPIGSNARFRFRGIDPAESLRRVFSTSNLAKSSFGIAKLTVAIGIAAWSLWAQRTLIARLAAFDTSALAAQIGELLLGTAAKIAGGLLVVAIADYAYQRWRHERDLRMTDAELREEVRSNDGDPRLTAQRRDLHRRRMQTRPIAPVHLDADSSA